MTTEAKKKFKVLMSYLMTGIVILTAMAIGAYRLLDAIFSGGGGGVGPT